MSGAAGAGVALAVVGAIAWVGFAAPSHVAESGTGSHGGGTSTVAVTTFDPLEPGERWLDLGIPGGSYSPRADAGGTDDYRCMLMDPELAVDTYLSGVVLDPGDAGLVHHAIVYRANPDQVDAARALDAADPDLGWSCFGGPGLPDPGGTVSGLAAAPWVAAFATTGGERRFWPGTGMELPAGSELVLQMHYNLLHGSGSDDSILKLRMAPPDAELKPLKTMLLPAPVELPCAPGEAGPLCERDAAVFDVMTRFGDRAGRTVAGLQLLCDGSLTDPRPGPTQSCSRPIEQTIVVRAVAGHMHLLGRSIHVDLDRANGASRTLMDIPVWDFDDQAAKPLKKPVVLKSGDALRVTCTHDAALRQQIPTLSDLAPRYVVWGEGSTDEMCLGIVTYTDS